MTARFETMIEAVDPILGMLPENADEVDIAALFAVILDTYSAQGQTDLIFNHVKMILTTDGVEATNKGMN